MRRPPLIIRILRNRRRLGLCLESLAELAYCKFISTLLPMRRWTGPAQAETLKTPREEAGARIRSVSEGLGIMARRVPWPSKCLDQALAAQRMLSRRGLDSTLYYGMSKDPARKWRAHAWVRCGDQWVVGHRESKGYTVVGAFVRKAR